MTQHTGEGKGLSDVTVIKVFSAGRLLTFFSLTHVLTVTFTVTGDPETIFSGLQIMRNK